MLTYLELARSADPRSATDLARLGLAASRLAWIATFTNPHGSRRPGWGRQLAATCASIAAELRSGGGASATERAAAGDLGERDAVVQAQRVADLATAYTRWSSACSWDDDRRAVVTEAVATAMTGFAMSLDAAQGPEAADRVALAIAAQGSMANYELCGGISSRVVARADLLRCADRSTSGLLAFPDPEGLASAVRADVHALETSRWPQIRRSRDVFAVVDEIHRLPAFLRAASMLLMATGSEATDADLLRVLDEWRVRCEEAVQRCWSTVLREVVAGGAGRDDGGGLAFLLPHPIGIRSVDRDPPRRWADFTVDVAGYQAIATVADEHRNEPSAVAPPALVPGAT